MAVSMGNQSLMISLPSCLLLTHCVCRREINMFPTLSINYALKVIVAGTAENCLILLRSWPSSSPTTSANPYQHRKTSGHVGEVPRTLDRKVFVDPAAQLDLSSPVPEGIREGAHLA